MKSLVLIGIGETAQLAFEYFTHDSDYTVIAFAVDDEYLPVDQPLMHNLPIIALSKLHQLYEPSEIELFVAVSSGKLNRVRRDLYTRFKQMDYTFATYISSKCFVWSNVVVGENCFVFWNIIPFNPLLLLAIMSLFGAVIT